ncbi:MAG: hypothetical protein COA50_01550 [Flavobacteriaceae bacterium]|nr:MAG: hypothetical protein COA50_01550 [Flavobacteriaceae bacterium]
MAEKKRHWFWNSLLIVTLIVCLFSFVVHYKNWTRVKNDNFEILSGVYHQKIPFSEMNSVSMEERLPKMERINGFSVSTTEKGVFKDSITNSTVYVFVDDLRQSKIKLQYKDSLHLFLNFSDSIQTQEQLNFFIDKIKE